jgi:hypothetical protein
VNRTATPEGGKFKKIEYSEAPCWRFPDGGLKGPETRWRRERNISSATERSYESVELNGMMKRKKEAFKRAWKSSSNWRT